MGHLLRIYVPLLLLGAFAGLVYSLGQRARTRTSRRGFQIAWILILLAGAPLWLLVATLFGWM